MQLLKGKSSIRTVVSIFSLLIIALFTAQSAFALTANTVYTLEMTKVNTDGTTTLVSTKNTTSDVNGKITFTFANVPTQATNKFLIVTVKDSAGVVQIKSFAPAPVANATNTLGINTTTTVQANLMEKLGTVIGTDDPMVVSFGLMFTRNPAMTATDIANFAIIGQAAIINGMEGYLTNHGVTAAQLTMFKNKIVYNATAGTTDLRDFAALTKSAVDTPANAKTDMAKASGLISAAFVDAAAASNIDLELILAAFDSAGIKLASGPAVSAMAALSASFRLSMNQSVQTFFTQLASVKVKQRYLSTLTALNASTAQKTRFTIAVTAMSTAMGNADALFALYFDGTAGYSMTETLVTAFAAGHLSNTGVINTLITAGTLATSNTIQTAMDRVYSQTFTTFSTDIQSTNAEIAALKTTVATALKIGVGFLPTSFGSYVDFNGATMNWPIPQTVAVNFVASIISAGGSLTYTRSGLTIPASMQEWFGSCSNAAIPSMTACTNGSATWTANTATAFNTGNASFDALLGLQEDIQIAEQTRFNIFAGGGNPTQLQMQKAKNTFMTNLGNIMGNLGGTMNGTTAINALQKKGLIKAQQQPSLH